MPCQVAGLREGPLTDRVHMFGGVGGVLVVAEGVEVTLE